MIIRQNKGIEQNSLYPDSNWYDNEPENIVIKDGSELAEKIKQYAPYFELNEDMTDITPTEKPPEPGPKPPEPSVEDYLLDLDYRLSKIELGV